MQPRHLRAAGVLAMLLVATFCATWLMSPSRAQAQAAQTDPPASAAAPSAAAGGGSPFTIPRTDANPVSRDAVVSFVQAHYMPHTLPPQSTPKVTRADLLTSGAISVLLQGENMGFPDAKSLWFVEVQGTFVFPGPASSQAGAQGSVLTAHVGYEIFDPDSGRLVMFGSLG